MIKVKTFNGVDVYFDGKDSFFCNPENNSGDFKEKMFNSERISSIEKAILNFTGGEVEHGGIYYEIVSHRLGIKELRVIRKVGSIVYFNDGSNSKQTDRRLLFPESVKQFLDFKEIKSMMDEITTNYKKSKKMQERNTELRKNIKYEIGKVSRVKPV